jgi:hypothetical protein
LLTLLITSLKKDYNPKRLRLELFSSKSYNDLW